jgi:hypothetical protein
VLQDVSTSGLTEKSIDAVRECVQTAASQLQSSGEAMAYCMQAESVLQHAIQCQSAEKQMKAGSVVSDELVQLQSMDQRVTSRLQTAERWCYLAASTRMGPPWEESEAVMELCLSLQKARSGASSISSKLLDQLSQCIDKLTVGSDLFVNSQRQRVKRAVGDAVQLRASIVQQIPELVGRVAPLLLSRCRNECSSGGHLSTAEQQQAEQLLTAACAQQSFTKQTLHACSMWISQIHCQNSTNRSMLIDLLSAAKLLSCTAERYGMPVHTVPPAPQSKAVHVHTSVACSVPTHAPALKAMRQPVMSTTYGTGNSMYSQAGMLMGGPPGMFMPQSVHPTPTGAIPHPTLQQGAAVSGQYQAPPPHLTMQQSAPVHGNDLVASLLSGGSGAQQRGSAQVSQAARGLPAVSSPDRIVGIPVAQSSAGSGSDPMLAMWNDLQH